MKKKYLMVPAILLTFVLVGAGCAGQNNTDTNNSVQDQMEQDVEDAQNNEEQNDSENQEEDNQEQEASSETEGEISLSAEARGEGKVYFEWSAPEDMNPERFVIVRDSEPNPVHNQKNYWFRQPASRTSVTWINIPSGDYHFRICAVKEGECTAYSNDVQVEVE